MKYHRRHRKDCWEILSGILERVVCVTIGFLVGLVCSGVLGAALWALWKLAVLAEVWPA